MNIVDLSIKRPILILMGLLAFFLFGLLSFFTIPISLFPDISIPYVAIQTVYPGASPDIIETQITKKIEEKISSIADLDSITSYSMDSVSIVIAAFNYGKDENLALQEVKDKVEVVSADFPDNAEKPKMSKVNLSAVSPVMSIVLQSDMPSTELYTYASTTVTDRLSQIAGVGSVTLSGGQEREIRVELDRYTVYEQSIPITSINNILAAANIEIPGGNFQYQNRDIPLGMKGKFKNLDEIRNLDVPTGNGIFKLRQLADVNDSSKTAREKTVLLDKKAGTRDENAIIIQIIKNPSANTVAVVEGVTEQINEIEAMSAGRVNLKVIKEDATYVRDSVNDTLNNIYLGIFLTGMVLLFFLHDIRSTIIVALAMPFSIISTFLVMKTMGISLNILSLMGLSSATGTLVANSVVVLENIFRHKEMGHSRIESASRGSKEVMTAVFASTLTNIAVFVPLANMSSIMGSMLGNFAYTIVISTVFSIIVSFTLTPLMASKILPEKVKREGKLSLWLEAFFKKWEAGYKLLLSFLIKNRWRSTAVVFITLGVFVFSINLASHMQFELFPQTDGGKIQITVELPQGNDIETTGDILEEIEKRLAGYKEVETIQTNLGTMGQLDQDVSVAEMNIFLIPISERSKNTNIISTEMIRDLSDIPGTVIRIASVSEIQISGTSGIDLFLKGEDSKTLQKIAEDIKITMNNIPGITNVSLSSKSGKLELSFIPDRKQISEDGLSVQAVALTLRAAVDGFVATTYKEGSEEYDVRVTIKDSALKSIDDIKNIPVVSSAGVFPLSRYADIYFSDSNSKIMRLDKVRTIEITADTLPGYAVGNLLSAITEKIDEIKMPSGYSVSQGGTTEMLGDTVRDLTMVFIIAVILVYMLLAATLESLTQPLFILSTVPLSIIGVIFLCLSLGTVLNGPAMLGIIMLVGIVVNNAILILDYYNQLKRNGLTTHDALLEACPVKLKPILMSNIAIVLGMLPMAIGMGKSGAEMRQPMGIVIIGGIISATILTLFLIPALENLLSHRSSSKLSKKEQEEYV